MNHHGASHPDGIRSALHPRWRTCAAAILLCLGAATLMHCEATPEPQPQILEGLTPDDATIVRLVENDNWIRPGESTYQQHCATCHGASGGGLAGPNLTDDFYLHVQTPADIASVIQDGAANGAMPAWGDRLHPKVIVLTASYVASLRGTNAQGKVPEGAEIPPWSPAP